VKRRAGDVDASERKPTHEQEEMAGRRLRSNHPTMVEKQEKKYALPHGNF